MLKKDLEYLGLSEKEALIYLAALELGKSPVQKIAEKAGINRATAYVIIETLSKKGLMSNYTEGKKQFFCAEAPEKLNLLFREEAMAIARRQEYLDKILPELRGLNKAAQDRPVLRYYEGRAGMRAIAEELFTTKNNEPARMLYSHDLLLEVFSKQELDDLRKRRQQKKYKVRSMINDDQNRLTTDADVVRIPSKEMQFTSDIAIFGDKVRMITQKEPLIGLIIENKEISDTLRNLFDIAWKYMKK